ncbi:hypothetical protein MCHI_002463 [Candidatus Magnetoovum chiemensis]|nr:hypothetical protein MCHI_002463 [Candidatus Magnetoovum chiemensis]
MTYDELMKGFENIKHILEEVSLNSKETDRRFKETDKKFEETDRRFKETALMLKETDKKVDRLTGKWGKFVLGLILPATEKLFKERGIEVHQISQNVTCTLEGLEMEIDILATNGEYAILIEAKSTLNVEDVKDHLERLGNFKLAFKQYSDKKIVGAVAGVVIGDGVDRFAYRNGLFVIAQSGDTVRILNDDKFKPKVF